MTARWVVDEVLPERDVSVKWQPISLLLKNNPDQSSDYYAPVFNTHRQLRVLESVRVTDGNDGVFALYWELGRRIHNDQDRDFSVVDALKVAGLDPSHAEAYDDEAWDAEIKTRMGVGLGLVGEDVGTPIIALDDDDGNRVGLFGPVITKVPSRQRSLRLWDAFIDMARIPGFWEVKRTRTERPEFGERPELPGR